MNLPSAIASEFFKNQSFPLINKQSINVDWWIPDVTAKGLVYLQHRFMGKASDLKSLGKKLADSGYIVFMPTVNVVMGNQSLAINLAKTLDQEGFNIPNDLSIPQRWVFIGHSAGALHVLFISATLVSMGNKQLQGVITLDGVDSAGKISPLLSSLHKAEVPIYAILSNSSHCNANNNILKAINIDPNSVQKVVQLTNQSSHLDPEGTDDNSVMMQILCHKSKPENTDWYHRLTIAWVNEVMIGAASPSSDELIQSLIDSGNGKVIL